MVAAFYVVGRRPSSRRHRLRRRSPCRWSSTAPAWASRARPATEAIMGVVPRAKAGVGSAVNDTTRLLGGTLGVAIIGSVYASLYSSRLTAARCPARPARRAGARGAQLGRRGARRGRAASRRRPSRARRRRRPRRLRRLRPRPLAGCLVAGGVAVAGARDGAALLPARPTQAEDEAAAGQDASASAEPLPAFD